MILRAKVAKTPLELEQGLMFVDDLAEDSGMLFVFHSARKLGFWGKNTLIPLDIAFIDHNFQIINISQIKPHSLEPVYSATACPMALEVNSGFFNNYDIEAGDVLDIDWGDHWRDEAVISFNKEVNASNVNSNKRLALNVPAANEQTVGQPIEQDQEVQEQQQNLPVIDSSLLGKILEDSYDDVGGLDDETKQHLEQPEGAEEAVEEIEQPEEPEVEYPVFSNPFEATEWAEKNGEVVRISYLTKHGRNLVRDVEPHGRFHAKSTSREILVTFDETVGDIRAFIVSNIKNWAFIGKRFDRKFIVKV